MTQPLYLSGSSNRRLEAAVAGGLPVGLMLQPGSGYAASVHRFPVAAIDNGCYAAGESFRLEAFLEYLQDPRLLAVQDRIAFVSAPDVVADAEATLRRAGPGLEQIRELGYRVAFVAQDGSEKDPGRLVPFSAFDVLFIGGTTEFKVDPQRGGRVARLARRLGKAVHMGRVNSLRRLRIAQAFGAATVDGTFLAFGPDVNLPRLERWIQAIEGGGVMIAVNVVVLAGRLSTDPEVQDQPDGSRKVHFRLQVPDNGKRVLPLPVVLEAVPGTRAARLQRDLAKGDSVMARGRLVRRFFRGAGGGRSVMEVVATEVKKLENQEEER